MNAFWVFVPGAVILMVGLIVFEWRNRKHLLSSAASTDEGGSEETNGPVG
jgi:hypothetical protein